jgi:hypothetical protein
MDWFYTNLGIWSRVHGEKGHIKAAEFIDAAKTFVGLKEGMKGMVDEQTGIIFGRAKHRFRINVKQMSDYYENTRNDKGEKFETIREMIEHEISTGNSNTDVACASRGILWFSRTLQFLFEALFQVLLNPKMELPTAFRNSYNVSLNKHHNALVRPIFSAVMIFCPTKEEFFDTLTYENGNLEQTYKHAMQYVLELELVKNRLVQFCQYMNIKQPGKWDVSFGDETTGLTEALVTTIVEMNRKRTEDFEGEVPLTKHVHLETNLEDS